MPSAGVEAVIVRLVVPVVEVACRPSRSVLVIADDWVRYRAQYAKGAVVPVGELRIGAFFVDVAQVEKEVGRPRVDQAHD